MIKIVEIPEIVTYTVQDKIKIYREIRKLQTYIIIYI